VSATRILTNRISYAALLALALVVGTLLGGAGHQAANPQFDRIVWLEQDAAAETGDAAVRRVLFADGRFLALTSDGYRAGVVDAAQTTEIFATVRAAAGGWASSYDTQGPIGERMDLLLEGPGQVKVTIDNPSMNFGLPSELGRVLRLLSAADTSIARVAFVPTSLRFNAVPLTSGSSQPMDPLPFGFPLSDASSVSGVIVGGDELARLRTSWTDLDALLDPTNAHRVVEVDGQAWRISWKLDVDAIGQLSPARLPQ